MKQKIIIVDYGIGRGLVEFQGWFVMYDGKSNRKKSYWRTCPVAFFGTYNREVSQATLING